MVREKIKVEDFDRISKEHEYYLWNFISKNQSVNLPTIKPIFDFENDEERSPNRLIDMLEIFDVNYFETYIEDSLDFLDMIGVPLDYLHKGHLKFFNPFMMTFNRRRFVNATYNGFCYCPEGITDLLYDLNPEIIFNAKLD